MLARKVYHSLVTSGAAELQLRKCMIDLQL